MPEDAYDDVMQQASTHAGNRTPVVRRALQDEVYDAVLHMLLSGEVTPGSPLGIDALATRLGVSPTPVREALVRLEATSLVERSAMRGYRVAPPVDATQVKELFDVRLVIELAAATRAYDKREIVACALAENRPEHVRLVDELEGTSDELSASAYAASLHRFYEADWSFHHSIANHCENRYLKEIFARLRTSFLRLQQIITVDAVSAAAALEEHDAIQSAFREGALADVERTVAHHVIQSRDRVLTFACKLPEPQ